MRVQITDVSDVPELTRYLVSLDQKLIGIVQEDEHCWVVLSPPKRLVRGWQAAAYDCWEQAIYDLLNGDLCRADLKVVLGRIGDGLDVDQEFGEVPE